MMRFLLPVLVFLGTLLVLARADDAAMEKELKALAGQWKLVAVEENGESLPKDKLPQISFTLRADGTATVRTPDGEHESKSQLDPAKQPKTLDIVDVSGPRKGLKQYGIYKVEGDRWTVVVATKAGAKAEDRPRDFNTKDMKGTLLMVWGRVKEDKKP
jgi:uncharacterized protein (TIGR03067 family)